MIGKQDLERLSQKAIKRGLQLGATQVEVVLWSGKEELTRFANNEIHQSVSLEDLTVHVRAILGKRIGVARGNSAEEKQIADIVAKAVEIASLQEPDPHFKTLPKKADYRDFSSIYQRSSHRGAMDRAGEIAKIIKLAKKNRLLTFGAFSESEGETLIANSVGVNAYLESKSANLNLVVYGKSGSGFAGSTAKGGKEIDSVAVAKKAITKATLGGETKVLPPGEYEVILEPPAVAELLDFFAWLGPNARIFHEEVSFLQENLGRQIFDKKLTIKDLPHHELSFPQGFDLEGHPKRELVIIEKGVAKRVAYDSYHAQKYSAKNTGHALLAPNTWGPLPTHLVITPGETELDEMINSVNKGILVTRFWYTRVVHHKELILTGMTRDGTFLIEKGKIVARLKNLRYTESVLSAFKNVKAVGRDLSLEGSEGFPHLVPHLHLAKFRFTGVAEHS